MNDSIKLILKNIEEIVNKNTKQLRENGTCFNLLEISGINNLEVKMCRILAELINPSGSHYQHTVFLKSFVKNVLNIETDDEELSQSQVITEYLIDNNRRIDIVITTPKRFIPIEVKLYAHDQKNQCLDYYNFASSKAAVASKVYYLTIDGHLPHENTGLTPVMSGNEVVGYEEIIPLSFVSDVCQWLDEIALIVSDKIILYSSIIQFKDSLEKLGGNVNNKINTEIADIISSSKTENRPLSYGYIKNIFLSF